MRKTVGISLETILLHVPFGYGHDLHAAWLEVRKDGHVSDVWIENTASKFYRRVPGFPHRFLLFFVGGKGRFVRICIRVIRDLESASSGITLTQAASSTRKIGRDVIADVVSSDAAHSVKATKEGFKQLLDTSGVGLAAKDKAISLKKHLSRKSCQQGGEDT